MFIVFLFGSSIGLILVACKLSNLVIIPILQYYFTIESDSSIFLTKFVIMFFLATISLPFALPSELSSKFINFSQISIVLILYMTILLFVEIFSYQKNYTYKRLPAFSLFKWNIFDFLKYFGNFAYSFNCIANVFTMMGQLKKNNHSKHIKKIYLFTTAGLFLIFSALGIIGYAMVGNDAAEYDLIILRDPLPGSKDIPMKICYLGVSMLNLIGFIMYIMPLKMQLYGFLKIRMTTCKNVTVTIFLVYVPAFIGWIYPYSTEVFGFLGAFFATMLSITFPGI